MDHLEFIKLLLAKGADPNLRVRENTLSRTIFTMQWFYESGATAFVRAAQSSDLELLKLLLAHGADPKLATDNGDTALTAAGGIGWVEGVTLRNARARTTWTRSGSSSTSVSIRTTPIKRGAPL